MALHPVEPLMMDKPEPDRVAELRDLVRHVNETLYRLQALGWSVSIIQAREKPDWSTERAKLQIDISQHFGR